MRSLWIKSAIIINQKGKDRMDHYQHNINDRCLSYSYAYTSAIKRLFKEFLYRSRWISIPRSLFLTIDLIWLSLQALLAYFPLFMPTLENWIKILRHVLYRLHDQLQFGIIHFHCFWRTILNGPVCSSDIDGFILYLDQVIDAFKVPPVRIVHTQIGLQQSQ